MSKPMPIAVSSPAANSRVVQSASHRPHPIVATAPGKVVLLGEYAVLEGVPAVVMAVDRYARVEVRWGGQRGMNCLHAPDLDIHDLPFSVDPQGAVALQAGVESSTAERLRLVCTVISRAFQQVTAVSSAALSAVEIFLDTSAFFGDSTFGTTTSPPAQEETEARGSKLGLGSSAALSAALYAALTASQDVLPQQTHPTQQTPPTRHTQPPRQTTQPTMPQAVEADRDGPWRRHVFETVMECHRAAQGGAGSGIDVAASVYGGVLEYRLMQPHPMIQPRSPSIARTHLPDGLHLLCVWTGRSTSTTAMLGRVSAFAAQHPDAYREVLTQLEAAASAGVRALHRGDAAAWCASVQAYYEGLARLSQCAAVPIVSATHRAIAEVVQRVGGVYKPSGAGGGDLGVAFCLSSHVAEQLRAALREAGHAVLSLAPAPQGVRVAAGIA